MTVTAAVSPRTSKESSIKKPELLDNYSSEIPLNDGQIKAGDDNNNEDHHQNDYINQDDEENIKCSAVHALERDMPNFDYSELVTKLRAKILDEIRENPYLYPEAEINKCREDDWHLKRFLLRQKLDLDQAFDMLKKAMRFKRESLNYLLKPQDFPSEFYRLGGLFSFGQDRKSNRMLYMRIKLHRKMPELQTILESYVYYNIEKVDREANGRGIVIVFDCTGSGVSNVDMDTLMFLISTLTKYFPKGLSYLLVHNLPWILKPVWHVAKLCIPEEYRQLVKFSDSASILEYVKRDQLPVYMGGTSKLDHCAVPENCTNLFEAAKTWGIELDTVREVLLRFIDNLPPDTLANFDRQVAIAAECKSKNGDVTSKQPDTDQLQAKYEA